MACSRGEEQGWQQIPREKKGEPEGGSVEPRSRGPLLVLIHGDLTTSRRTARPSADGAPLGPNEEPRRNQRQSHKYAAQEGLGTVPRAARGRPRRAPPTIVMSVALAQNRTVATLTTRLIRERALVEGSCASSSSLLLLTPPLKARRSISLKGRAADQQIAYFGNLSAKRGANFRELREGEARRFTQRVEKAVVAANSRRDARPECLPPAGVNRENVSR